MKKENKTYYTERIDRLSAEMAVLKQRNRYFVMAEVVTFLLFIGFIALYTMFAAHVWLLAASPLALVAYVAVRRMDERNDYATDRLAALIRVYRNELSYLSGDYTCFRTGQEYADPAEPFSFDLDVFGPQSLFNRICRTLTTGGSRFLARCLSSFGMTRQEIEARGEAVDELAQMEEWRAKYMSCGAEREIDTDALARSLGTVCGMKMPAAALSPVIYGVACLSVAGLWTAIVLSSCFSLMPGVPGVWAILQLFVVFMLCKGVLGRLGRSLDYVHGHIGGIARLVGQITRLKCYDVKSEELRSIISSLDEAEGCFSEMENLIKSYDRRGSLVLILSDMLFLSDYFLLRKTMLWQRKYAGRTERWIEAVSRIDAIVSMATFRYNEPEAGHAVVEEGDDVVYEARGLYHPFLGAKAVRNDFTVRDGNYYIVTGANMAGKSTFLRSIGVNYILAMNGMPVFAASLRVTMFSLFSSMRTTDDLAHGISYFNAELLRLKQLIAYCRRQRNTLIILDEILKGTNSLDKLNGSRLFLEYISQMRVSGIIATHDLELSKMEQTCPDRFHNYCFEIKLAERVTYSYLITPGVARNQNATFLLKAMLGDNS